MRILVAEDDSITTRLLQAHLTQSGHEVVLCADGGQAWNVLNADDPPNLVVLDWMMPGMDGLTICRELRKREVQGYTYIILLTGKTRMKDVIEGLEAGADELKVRVRAGSRIIQLQQQLVAALAASEYQASHDHLTGLWNRRAITGVLDRELARTHRHHGSLGVVMGDLDHFKRNLDIMEKYQLSSKGLQSLFTKPIEAKAVRNGALNGRVPLGDDTVGLDQPRAIPRNYLCVKLPVYASDNLSDEGHVNDITEKGLQVVGISATVGESKTLVLQPSGFDDIQPFAFDALCRWVMPGAALAQSLAGFEITDISEGALGNLRKLIRALTICD